MIAALRELRPHCAAILAKTLRSLAARVQLFFAPKNADQSAAVAAYALQPIKANLSSAPLRFNPASTRL